MGAKEVMTDKEVTKEMLRRAAPVLNPMTSKIMRCTCGSKPGLLQRRMFSLMPPLTYSIRCIHSYLKDPAMSQVVQTREHPHLYQAINEWNRMQMGDK